MLCRCRISRCRFFITSLSDDAIAAARYCRIRSPLTLLSARMTLLLRAMMFIVALRLPPCRRHRLRDLSFAPWPLLSAGDDDARACCCASPYFHCFILLSALRRFHCFSFDRPLSFSYLYFAILLAADAY